MNNCRAGLYSFASTTAWLHETGIASPPLLVMLGLMLPDSRILSGVAGIGLTLVDIAIIVPHLRQPILDSIRASEKALADAQCAKEQTNLSHDGRNPTQRVDVVEPPVLAPALPSESDHQRPPLECSATAKSLCSADPNPRGCPDVELETSSETIPAPPVKTDVGPVNLSLDAGASEWRVGANRLFARVGRGALYTPLPVPDAEEVAFFDTEDATFDLEEEEYPTAACEWDAVFDRRSPIEEERGWECGKGISDDGQRVVADALSAQGLDEKSGNSMDAMMHTMVDAVPPLTDAVVQADHKPVAGDAASESVFRDGAVQSTETNPSLVVGKEALAKRRPESLKFIPQSVIRRYASTGHCLGHRTFGSENDTQFQLEPPHDSPGVLLEGTRPRATRTTLEGLWDTSLSTRTHPTRQSIGWQTFTIRMDHSLEQDTTSLSTRPAAREPSLLRKYPIHRRRLGVLGRAALRDRRYTARMRRNDDSDGSSTPDSGSDSESESDYSTGSSADESILPRILGTDLIAAIDANSESDLRLVTSRKTKPIPLNLYDDFLFSEDSTADVSIIIQVSSHDDASDGEVVAPAVRALTYEDIQQWATGVVQKCVRPVCRRRVHAEPSSPSQASDVCAERPTGLGAPQCPLSGLHCKPSAAAPVTGMPASQKNKEEPGPFPPGSTSTQSRTPLQVRNPRDIPEFVPRQRCVSAATNCVEGPRRFYTKSNTDVARDAATRVIARMENQARFNARQWLVGVEEKRMVNTAGGRQGMFRCA